MSWSEQDSEAFLQSGDFFVPERALQFSIIGDLIAASTGSKQLTELCCGGGQLTQYLLRRFPQAKMMALDGSQTMLAATLAQVGEYADRLTTKQFDLADIGWRSECLTADAVVSSLAVHHLDGPGKQTLFTDIARMLNPGGVFILADLVEATTPAGKAISGAMWDKAVKQVSMERLGNLAAYQHFRDDEWNYFNQPQPADTIDQPSSLHDQLDWLRNAGFIGVDVHWMRAGHVIMSGTKAS